MAFKSGGGFVIRPIVTADSISNVSNSVVSIQTVQQSEIDSIKLRLLAVETKITPATSILSYERITHNGGDITVSFSKPVSKVLSSSDFEFTGCSLSNYRQISTTVSKVTVQATNPTQFSVKLLKDQYDLFLESATMTKIADYKTYNTTAFSFDGDFFRFQIATVGNPVSIVWKKKPEVNSMAEVVLHGFRQAPFTDPPYKVFTLDSHDDGENYIAGIVSSFIYGNTDSIIFNDLNPFATVLELSTAGARWEYYYVLPSTLPEEITIANGPLPSGAHTLEVTNSGSTNSSENSYAYFLGLHPYYYVTAYSYTY